MATPPTRSSTTGATATHLPGNAGGEEEEEEEGRHRRRRRRWSAAAAAEEEASASATTLRLARRGVRTSDITSMTQRNERPADDAVAVVVAVVAVVDWEGRRCCRVIFVLSLWRERLHLLLYILVLLAISLPCMSTVICEALNNSCCLVASLRSKADEYNRPTPFCWGEDGVFSKFKYSCGAGRSAVS